VIDLHSKLKDIKKTPAFDKSCDPRCSIDRAVHPIAKKLLYVPHYKIANNLNLDQEKIIKEIESIDSNWHGYNNDVKGTRGAGVSNYWSSKFLRNFSEDPDFGFGETLDFMEILGKQDLVVNGRVAPEHLVDTTLHLPYIRSIIEQFVTWEMCDRIMISRIDNSQRINWHSHNYYETTYTHGYLHIPLITNENANMLVYMDDEIHVQHYGFNEAWIINTQHNHAVNNKNGSVRYHVLCLANFEDPKFAKFFLSK
jgi:hypothetical protein